MKQKVKLLPVASPEPGKPVKVVLKHSEKWIFHTDVILIHVEESDVHWRFHDDGSELSYDWDVIYWEYLGD